MTELDLVRRGSWGEGRARNQEASGESGDQKIKEVGVGQNGWILYGRSARRSESPAQPLGRRGLA